MRGSPLIEFKEALIITNYLYRRLLCTCTRYKYLLVYPGTALLHLEELRISDFGNRLPMQIARHAQILSLRHRALRFMLRIRGPY